MNFSSMDYFVMVARERSFSRAAERLHITQQTLSAHIAGLEKELGTKLLVRSIPLELTYAGEVFLGYAVDLQRKLGSMEREFQDLTGNQRGLLRIGVATIRGRIVMPSILTCFRARYPKIAIRLVEDENGKLLEYLENREIDLAVALFPQVVPGVELVGFYQEEVVLLVPQAILDQVAEEKGPSALERLERGDLSSLQGAPFLLEAEEDDVGKIGYSFLSQAGIVSTPAVEAYSLETLLILCARGLGACFFPENWIQAVLSPEQRAGLRLFRLGEDARYTVRFGYSKQGYPGRVITDFIQLARETGGSF